jgi:hypothetical protein
VTYAWIRTDQNGRRTVIQEPSLTIAPGDTSRHTVVPDFWTPQSAGSEQLVFSAPAAPAVGPRSFACANTNQNG